ncbi:hypothetical protein GCU67_18625 [Modestobacter muralis]|uniref:Uncharacterized protein n=1 Tax=Modestobacter muralis TaxID=1608614 RepID=A0A6P0EYM8_9ACTN|nr:hypothetical protein [Modestobacter muralis]NEK96165.1 hypothetical protein [Modestobacter muralis]NEN53053.1 hypothetical protein [Modestobacter muralis]
MTPVTSHHVRAVVGSAADGLVLALCGALLDHPARSAARRRLYLAMAGVAALDVGIAELPGLRAALADGVPPERMSAEELEVRLQQGLVVGAWAVVLTVVDGPLARALRDRGVARPHLLLGAVAGLGAALSTLPSWWRQADEGAAVDQATARLDEELAELLDQPAG